MKKLVVVALGLWCYLGAEVNPYSASISEIDTQVQGRMKYSWKEDSPVPLSDLRYIKLAHWGFDGKVYEGELVMHKDVAAEVVEIFRELYEIRFPIERMVLVDEFEGDDDRSINAHNTYAHCARPVARTSAWSNHAYGLAIDINPHLNPYLEQRSFGFYVCPKSCTYLDRRFDFPGAITRVSPIYEIFRRYGWEWAGESLFYCQDLHHFQKVIPGLNKSSNHRKYMESPRTVMVKAFADLYRAIDSSDVLFHVDAGDLFIVSAVECDDANTMWFYGMVQGSREIGGWIKRSCVSEYIGA